MQDSKRTLTLYLLSHDRALMAVRAASAVLRQTSKRFKFVVSDNSRDSEAIDHLRKLNESLLVIDRERNLDARLHWKLCVEECDSTYIALLHDDDELHVNFVETFWAWEDKIERFSALGINAVVYVNNLNHKWSFSPVSGLEGPFFSREILDSYFAKFSRGIVPFPGYIFRTSMLKEVCLERNYGKYSDVRILVELANHAGIYRVASPAFDYHLHGSNDGQRESFSDRLRFLAYLKEFRSKARLRRQILDYRFFLYQKHKNRFVNRSIKTRRKIFIFLIYYRYSRLLDFFFYKRLFLKLRAKLNC